MGQKQSKARGAQPARRTRRGLLALAVAGLLALALAPAAGAVSSRPFLEDFGPAEQPLFTQPKAVAFDSAGYLLVGEGSNTDEKQELRIEAASNLGGTYKLSFEGQSTGWKGEADLTNGGTAVTGAHSLAGALVDGEQISGTGIQPGTTVSEVNEGAGTFTLSQPATATGTSSDLSADLFYNASFAEGPEAGTETRKTIERALEKLPSIGVNNVSVAGVIGGQQYSATSLVQPIQFVGSLGERPLGLLSCDGSGLTGTSPTCTVTETASGHRAGILRYHEDGTPAPFAALGTNLIDGRLGYGGLPCAEEPSSCDKTPEGKLVINSGPNVVLSGFAIDRSGGATDGSIYVPQSLPRLVDIFDEDGRYHGQITKFFTSGSEKALGEICGTAVDDAGALYLGDYSKSQVHKYVPQGAPHSPLVNADNVANFKTVTEPCGIAAGAGPTAGSIFVNSLRGPVVKIDAESGALQYVIVPEEYLGARAVAVNSATGSLFVAMGTEKTVREYDASGPLSATLLSEATLPLFAAGMAANPASDYLYVTGEDGKSGYLVETYGSLLKPGVLTGSVSGLNQDGATLNGTVDPNGEELGSCSFEWGLAEAPYEHTEPCAETPAEIGAGSDPVAVHLELSGLVPGANYHYRLVAENLAGETEGSEAFFTTVRPPAIAGESVQGVGSSEALVRATINPEGFATTYWVEYGPTAAYGQSTPVRSLGPVDASFHEVGFNLEGLTPGTAYHWRFVADNTDPLFPGTGSEAGEDRLFTTFGELPAETDCPNQAYRTGPSAGLPDCRAYEMVTPLDKEGGDILAIDEVGLILPSTLNQSSVSGDKLAYGSYRAFGDAVSAAFTSQYVAARQAGVGWSSHSILGPRGKLNLKVAQTTNSELKALSPDLCESWTRTVAGAPLAPGGVADFPNLYQRQDQECGGGPTVEAITTIAPEHGRGDGLGLKGTSTDGAKAIYATGDNLPGTGAPDLGGSAFALYFKDRAAATAHYVCVLPSGLPYEGSCSAGVSYGDFGQSRLDNVQNAISEDGSRVFWTAAQQGPGKIYVRLNPGQAQSALEGEECTEPTKACTLAVSKAAEALSGTTASRYWSAAEDGSKAIFTSGTDLYEYDVATKATKLIAKKSAGIMGASADASKIYLASEEVLAAANPQGGEPQEGERNLYLYEAESESFKFVATLVGSDFSENWAAIASEPSARTSRVSPDGLQAAFMSSGQPTGYDNTAANSGEPAAEVYRYDATANGGGGELLCVSCNPTGSRPLAEDIENGTKTFWAAAETPIWSSTLYAPSALAEDGHRVYFNAADALSPSDTNGVRDVYEWEAPGAGGCEEGGAGYSELNGGCIRLISSGRSARKAEFVDASPSGSDVFFSTTEGLLPQDYGLIDIYDARAGGGFPLSQPPPAACEGEACQSAPEAPNDPTPASAAFEGAGNVHEEPQARKPCAKGKVRRHGRCMAKKHRHAHKRAKRNGRTGR